MKNMLVLLITAFSLFSCQSSADKHSAQHPETHEQHEANPENLAIELDNGEKWIVNEEMKPFVAKGSELVDQYLQNEGADFKTLATDLKTQNDALIKSCTMTGKSHEELHKWLHPHLQMQSALAQTENSDEAKKIAHEIQDSYKQYHNYFK